MAGASRTYRVAFNAIHEMLMREWNPIGVGDEPRAQNEYDSYIPSIYRLISEGADAATIAKHLERIATVDMGCQPDPRRSLAVAHRLLDAGALLQRPGGADAG